MKRELNSIVSEIFEYSLKITGKRNDLTEIKKRDYHRNIKEELQFKGINFKWVEFSNSDYFGDPFDYYIEFDLSHIDVEGVCRIIDVQSFGSFPLLLSANNALILYEPRDLTQLLSSETDLIDNREFLNLAKGENFQINGKITECRYNKNPKKLAWGHLVFKIKNEEHSLEVQNLVKELQHGRDIINQEKEIKARKEARSEGIIGAIIGVFIGLAIFIGMGILGWIFSFDVGNGFYYMFLTSIITGAFGYYDKYLTIKKSRGLLG